MLERIEKEDVSVGAGIIKSYQRMPQKMERVFAEFIDNSTQSFRDHLDAMKKINNSPVCKVTITWNDNEIVIEDKAYGMDRDDFRRALKLNTPKKDYSENSRSQYGMGLKIAASYLGNWYSIESTQYGKNEKYYAVVDIDDWVLNNPTEIDNRITIVNKEEHFTKITIKKLEKKLTNSIESSLMKKLAQIYKKDLESGDLEIYFNGKSVQPMDPDLWLNTENNSEFLDFFEGKFDFNNEEYTYSGWIGILKTASTDDAGFTLLQYGRGIKLNYRPTDIFGKSNSFPYQRVVGEIQLDDQKWKVSFNKDEFIWDDGLEKAFKESLKSNRVIKEMITIATKLRKEGKKDPIVKPEDIKKSREQMEDKYKSLSNIEKTYTASFVDNKPTVVIKPEDNVISNIINIKWESIEYSFDVQVKNDDPDCPWFTLQKKNENNSHYIILNGSSQYFANYSHKDCKNLIVDFAITLALAQLSSVRLGLSLDKSSLFVGKFNEIIKNAN